MAANSEADVPLEIGHVLFMDVVGYSKLLINEQRELQQQLSQIVRDTEPFRSAETAGKLIRLPVGDGMALVFFDRPEAPVLCALEISKALKENSRIQLRMRRWRSHSPVQAGGGRPGAVATMAAASL
jgi:hypothetical protein